MKIKYVIRRKFKILCIYVKMFLKREMYKYVSNCYALGIKINKIYLRY